MSIRMAGGVELVPAGYEDQLWDDDTGQRFLYRHRPATTFTISEIQENYLWAASRQSLNDPTENVIEYRTALDQAAIEAQGLPMHTSRDRLAAAFLKARRAAFKTTVRTFKDHAQRQLEKGVVCFSMSALSRTMMAHYGNNQGVVICYDREKLESVGDKVSFREIDYVDEPSLIELSQLKNNKGVFDATRVLSGRLYQKHKDWSYEKEIRMLYGDGLDKRIQLPKGAIRAVCFDIDCALPAFEIIAKLCLENDIDIYEAKSGEGYSLKTLKLIRRT